MLGINISTRWVETLRAKLDNINLLRVVAVSSFIFSVIAISYCFSINAIVAYGDAESHLNLAKRVVSSITPGLAQLGGIWLPLPHLMMLPFIWHDFMWQTGLAGSIVSGLAFIVSSIYIFKLILFLTKSKWAALAGYIVYALNPNMLYLQSTPMTEPILICFFVLSSYYFIRFIYQSDNYLFLLYASFFSLCASLSRYDGWFLVMVEGFLIGLYFLIKRRPFQEVIGKGLLYGTMASVGILLWFLWGYLILGNPLYFSNSEYSARTQQLEWQERGQLPAYHNAPLAFTYFFVDTMSNTGMLIFFVAIVGFYYFLFKNDDKNRFYVAIILMIPFIFNTLTLFIGQSIIFIPHLTPVGFDWRLFNVRYGIIMLPAVGFFFGYLFWRIRWQLKLLLIAIFLMQTSLYFIGYSKILSYADGREGLSSAKRGDVEIWMQEHYDGGMILMDDYARSISIIGAKFPMQQIIYVGNKPYWEESMSHPEKYATWVVIQENDAIWTRIYKTGGQKRLYKYFQKVYTSPRVIIFKRNTAIPREDGTATPLKVTEPEK